MLFSSGLFTSGLFHPQTTDVCERCVHAELVWLFVVFAVLWMSALKLSLTHLINFYHPLEQHIIERFTKHWCLCCRFKSSWKWAFLRRAGVQSLIKEKVNKDKYNHLKIAVILISGNIIKMSSPCLNQSFIVVWIKKQFIVWSGTLKWCLEHVWLHSWKKGVLRR